MFLSKLYCREMPSVIIFCSSQLNFREPVWWGVKLPEFSTSEHLGVNFQYHPPRQKFPKSFWIFTTCQGLHSMGLSRWAGGTFQCFQGLLVIHTHHLEGKFHLKNSEFWFGVESGKYLLIRHIMVPKCNFKLLDVFQYFVLIWRATYF